MKNLFYTLILLQIISIETFPQWNVNLPTDIVLLQSVFFKDSVMGWAAGSDILLTTDGGENWNIIGTNYSTFNSIYFVNLLYGWAVNDYGNILHSTDGGNNWLLQNSGTTSPLKSIFFKDSLNGFITMVNGIILRTSNSGFSWDSIHVGQPVSLLSINFVDQNNGWVVGSYGTILRTTNGGNDWIKQNSGTQRPLVSVCFIDLNYGWIVGNYGTILHTTDSGNSWLLQQSPLPYRDFESCQFIDKNKGWIVGEHGAILYTTNGGEDWIDISFSCLNTNHHQSVFFLDQFNGWVVGYGRDNFSNYQASILHTQTGGITFIDDKNNIDKVKGFELYQNYPNPFNPSTKIQFVINKRELVSLKVHDLLGNEIDVLVNEEKDPGIYEVEFNAKDLSSGVYFFKMKAGNFSKTKKILLMK